MGSSKKGMLNVLIAAVLWGSSGVCAQFIMQESQMSSPFLTMTRLLFAGLILLMLGFVHGDRIFRVLQNRRDALSLLFFSLFGALTVQFTFLMTIEKSNAATATVLQFLSPTIIVAWFALARKARPTPLVLGAICTSLAGTFLLVTHGNPTTLSISPAALMLFGGAMLLPFYGGQGTDFVVNGSLLLAFFYLVVIGTSLTFSLYLNGAQKIGGAKAGILSCAEPLSSALLSLLLLGITFTLPDWLGTLLILASVVLIAIDSRRRVRAA
ncbi:EamA family transporter [Klebsiella pneumoniae]|uniref:EamA family transporter n=1 Tax=Klebsiella pneumoniae TaxID=573 RepID=UPI002F2B82AA